MPPKAKAPRKRKSEAKVDKLPWVLREKKSDDDVIAFLQSGKDKGKWAPLTTEAKWAKLKADHEDWHFGPRFKWVVLSERKGKEWVRVKQGSKWVFNRDWEGPRDRENQMMKKDEAGNKELNDEFMSEFHVLHPKSIENMCLVAAGRVNKKGESVLGEAVRIAGGTEVPGRKDADGKIITEYKRRVGKFNVYYVMRILGRIYTDEILRHAAEYADSAKRKTVSSMDTLFAIEQARRSTLDVRFGGQSLQSIVALQKTAPTGRES